MRDLPDDNLSYPVLVEIADGSGSGFYFHTEKKLFLVTALHVLYLDQDKKKALRGSTVTLTYYDKDITIKSPAKLHIDLSSSKIRKNDLKDIALIEIADIALKDDGTFTINFVKGVQREGSSRVTLVAVPPKSLKKFHEVLVSNEVFILGYPSSLGSGEPPQIDPKQPLLRKGIVAGLNTKNETIILDCPVYFGNSGGLAIEVDSSPAHGRQFRIIGVVSQFIPFVEQLKSAQLGYTNLNFENSGYSVVVPMDTIYELTKEAPEVLKI